MNLKLDRLIFWRKMKKNEFYRTLERNGNVFSFYIGELGCIDPSVVPPMTIFTIPHSPWKMKPIPLPKATLSNILEMLKEKEQANIIEPCCSPCSNR